MNTLLLPAIIEPHNISSAWQKVRSNKGAPGEDAIDIRELETSFDSLWPAVERSIRENRYQPVPLRQVFIPKSSGGVRCLSIPSVIDRIVQQAAAQALGLWWEPRLTSSAYAYRPGTGARAAIDSSLATAGCLASPWALRLDIADFFDTLPWHVSERSLALTPCSPEVIRLCMQAITCPAASWSGPVGRVAGLPQGSPISPLLSNVALMPF